MCHRQPEFSGGDRSCWWELTCLGGHVHPSVAAFARSLLAGTFVSYDGDPLRDLTLTAFLDKFVQRKPKVPRCIFSQALCSCLRVCAAGAKLHALCLLRLLAFWGAETCAADA